MTAQYLDFNASTELRIVAYMRALQLSQNAIVNDVPADLRGNLGGATELPIVAYIRALQLSQNAIVNDVPADRRANLGGAK